MKRKIRVGVIFGGKSGEHEVSLQSARSVIEAMDKDKYEPVLFAIDKKGKWHLSDPRRYLLNAGDPAAVRLSPDKKEMALVPGEEKERFLTLNKERPIGRVDVVFPVLHGPFGEDGTVQGLLKLAEVPFVGPGVLGSAVGMDKDVMKRLFREAGIPTPKFLVFKSRREADFKAIKRELGLPFFVKPANLGSSIGISKVHDEPEFRRAIADAFRYDRKVLAEEAITGREIECAVLGNERPRASVPGEIIPRHEFYSYEAKYLDENGAALRIPADLPRSVAKKVQKLAVRVFTVLGCEGMGRVDFFLTKRGAILANEINTIPGFTKISMYPKLWEASGLPYPKLIDKLIELALERFGKEKKLLTSYAP